MKKEVKEEKLEKKNSKKKWGFVVLIILLLILVGLGVYYYFFSDNDNSNEVVPSNNYSIYRITSNSLEPFDLYFLQLENKKDNMIYSPLSIKYALEMLNEGTDGDSKEQISNIIGEYKANKYTNSENMSLANAMFINDKHKDTIREDYVSNLKDKYNAEVVYDPFETTDNINKWISDKTLNLLDNVLDDFGEDDPRFALVNAVAIDMEWEDKFIHNPVSYEDNSNIDRRRYTDYPHISYGWDGPTTVSKENFDNDTQEIAGLEVMASLNNYDIIKELGEENIRETIEKEYREYLKSDSYELNGDNSQENIDRVVNEYLDRYIKELDSNYGKVDFSTDMSIYVDDNIKVFGKDLKEYNGTTLQYVGIMPIKDDLNTFVNKTNAKDLDELIKKLKELKLENFKDGVLTEITGYIPKFKFDYELKLKDDLNKLGVYDVFDPDKANLSKLTTEKGVYIDKSVHKANIEFTEDGLKASASTVLIGGKGAGGFDHLYEIPVEKIDITFDKPYMFLIRDKESGEVWFTGTVYRPLSWEDEPTKDKLYY